MDKPRRFKLRNGIIVEEWDRGDFTNTNKDGYIDDYKILDKGGYSGHDCGDVGDRICLLLQGTSLPSGGAYGPDFDIIEEVPVV